MHIPTMVSHAPKFPFFLGMLLKTIYTGQAMVFTKNPGLSLWQSDNSNLHKRTMQPSLGSDF